VKPLNLRVRPRTPPFLRRRVLQFIGAIIAASLTGLIVQWAAHGRVPLWAFIAASVVPGASCGVVSVCFAFGMRRNFTRAKDVGGRVCWNCGYVLAGLADDGTCPECGNAYAIKDLRARWMLSDW